MSPSPRLVRGVAALALVGVTPAVLGPAWVGIFVAAGLGLLLLVGLEVALATPARALRPEVQVPSVVALGVKDAIRVTLPALSRPIELEATADLCALLVPVDPVAVRLLPGVAPHVALPLDARRRGEAVVAAVHLRWTGPFGLLRRTLRVPVGRTVAVVPDLAPVRQAALRFAFDREFLTGARQVRRAGGGSEFEALREHEGGMDPRAIDWKASARHVRLVSRETRAERDRPVVLALDAGRVMSETVAGLPRLDHAVTTALLLGYAALKTGDRVGLFAFDDAPRAWLPPVAGPGAYARLLAAVSGVGYAGRETNFARAVADLTGKLRRRSLVVVLTDFTDSTTAELMMDAAGRLARRHVLLFVAMRDPVLTSLAEAPPATARAMHRAVVAADLLRDREVVLARLRRFGAHVVDATPDCVTSEALDRYLHVHRRELVG